MALVMGIDTGGTYTDGVILDTDKKKILSKTKVFTQRNNLSSSINECIDNLMLCKPENVSLVCLSTTLATNAIVEGRRGKVGLLLIGGRPDGALPADICIELQGKLSIKGAETESLSPHEVYAAVMQLEGQVEAIAVSGYASVRNPSHELQVKDMIREKLPLPVICGHELTSQLGYYERTVTAVLNAGLIPVISDLVQSVQSVLSSKEIDAPIMIVKGDGSLMQASYAVEKPIDTILSGPAASVTGAVYLTGLQNALVLDMGGTTTDFALISDGGVKVKKAGAKVGGWMPRIPAADIRTFGLGGDSLINVSTEGELLINPRKVQPLCMAADRYPDLIGELRQILSDTEYDLKELSTDCYGIVKEPENIELSNREERILNILRSGAHSLLMISRSSGEACKESDMERLVSMDILQRISMTPTDILHILGKYQKWNEEISIIGAVILAKKMNRSLSEFTEAAVEKMTKHLLDACRESLFELKGTAESGEKNMFFEGHMIAIGAPVKAWVPAVSERLKSVLIIPGHAEVANAVGAAAGQIFETAEALIRPNKEADDFIVHSPWERRHFKTLPEAAVYASAAARRQAYEQAETAGGIGIELSESRKDIYVDGFQDSTRTFIETRIRATATGSPAWRPF